MSNKDLFGVEIVAGDYILRPLSLGRSCSLSVSKVLKSDDKGLRVANVRNTWRRKLERTKDGTIQHTERCVKVAWDTIPEAFLTLLDDPEPKAGE